jgi:hypothetical protein
MRPLSAGKSRVYDLMHKGTVTALIAVAAYGLFEVGRGSFYIMNSNRAARAVSAAGEGAEPRGVLRGEGLWHITEVVLGAAHGMTGDPCQHAPGMRPEPGLAMNSP